MKPNLNGSKILVVDDVPANLRVMRDALEANDFSVMIAKNGEATLQVVRHQTPDLILLDVMLPDIDGFEVCRQLKERDETRDIPVIFVTAKDEISSLAEGFQAGGVDYVLKPFQIEEVMVRMRTHLTLAYLQRELQGSHDALESQVAERTSELATANEALRGENEERKRLEAARLELLRRLVTAQEQERNRIATELHDGIGQDLLIMVNRADYDKGPDAKKGGKASERLTEIHGHLKHTIQDIRDIAHNLRPFLLDKVGLTKALNAMVNHVTKTGGIEVRADLEIVDGILRKDTEVQIYRVVQECFNNVLKHSSASMVQFVIRRRAESVMIRLSDDGCGFDARAKTAEVESRSGFGLIGMADRVRLMNGDWSCQSAPGEGTTIQIVVPLDSEATANDEKGL